MKRISKKLISIILIIITLLSVFQGYSQAETEIDKADVKGGDDLRTAFAILL